jgi:hypothetical protein
MSSKKPQFMVENASPLKPTPAGGALPQAAHCQGAPPRKKRKPRCCRRKDDRPANRVTDAAPDNHALRATVACGTRPPGHYYRSGPGLAMTMLRQRSGPIRIVSCRRLARLLPLGPHPADCSCLAVSLDWLMALSMGTPFLNFIYSSSSWFNKCPRLAGFALFISALPPYSYYCYCHDGGA